MRKILITAAAIVLASASASAQAIEGQWTNPKRSVVVKVTRCGAAYCGTIIEASEKAKAKARKGGTPNLVGTQILTGLKPIGAGGAYQRLLPSGSRHAWPMWRPDGGARG